MLQPDRLSQALKRLSWQNEQGQLPSSHARRLQTLVNEIARDLEREAALVELAKLLPGTSRWDQAGLIEATLRRFQGTAWPRIQRGSRPAQPGLETACARVLSSGGPFGQRHVWEVLRENSRLNQRVQKFSDNLADNLIYSTRELIDDRR